jgi:hypothetical protein
MTTVHDLLRKRFVPILCCFLLSSLACSSIPFLAPTPTPTLTATPTETPTDTPTKTPKPSRTPTPSLTPTKKSAVYPAGWQRIFFDSFDDNSNDWPMDPYSGPWGSVQYLLGDGNYSMELACINTDGFFFHALPGSIGNVKDFYLELEGTLLSGAVDTEFGVIFRHSENGFYAFVIQPDRKQYALWLNKDGAWTDIISMTRTSTVIANQSNRLGLLVQGESMQLFLNDHKLDQATDSTFSTGTIGLGAGLHTKGDSAKVMFDNFEILGP